MVSLARLSGGSVRTIFNHISRFEAGHTRILESVGHRILCLPFWPFMLRTIYIVSFRWFAFSLKSGIPQNFSWKPQFRGITNKCIYIYIYSIFSIMNSVLISLKWSSNSKFPISSHFILPISFHYFPFVSMSWWWLSHLSPLSLQFPTENHLNSPMIVDKVPLFPPLELLWMHKRTELSSDPPSFSILIPLFIPCFPIFPQFFPNFSLFFSHFPGCFLGPGDLGGVAAAATRQVGWAAEAAPGGTAVPGISREVPWGSSMGGHVNWGNLIRWGRTGGCCGNHKWEICGNFRGNF